MEQEFDATVTGRNLYTRSHFACQLPETVLAGQYVVALYLRVEFHPSLFLRLRMKHAVESLTRGKSMLYPSPGFLGLNLAYGIFCPYKVMIGFSAWLDDLYSECTHSVSVSKK